MAGRGGGIQIFINDAGKAMIPAMRGRRSGFAESRLSLAAATKEFGET